MAVVRVHAECRGGGTIKMLDAVCVAAVSVDAKRRCAMTESRLGIAPPFSIPEKGTRRCPFPLRHLQSHAQAARGCEVVS
eukprot:1418269-Rhodomonas_salina.1